MRRRQFRQRRHRPAVQFHGGDIRRRRLQQRAGQPAGARPHLQHMPACEIAGERRDASAQRLIQQEMLAE
jgi:hypothetical protein